jgi:hypothetical protein
MMTDAQVRPDGPTSAMDELNHIGSVLTIVASWIVAVVFIKWCLAGPPVPAGGAPLLLAAVRALLGLLVIAIVRLRPAAVLVAWMLSLVIALHASALWWQQGSPVPYALWEVIITAGYVVFIPIAIWATPQLRRLTTPVRRPVEPRRTTSPSRPIATEPYGPGLANKVADLLERGQSILYVHKEYCGTGMRFLDGKFVYDDVVDGELSCMRTKPPTIGRALAVFPDRASFVTWLAGQCDQSLSGRDREDPWYWNNQRITRTRLERAVEVARVTGEFQLMTPGPPISELGR